MSSESLPPAEPSRPPEVADLVAAAALGVDGVHALAAGGLGGVATYLAGRRVSGVAVREAEGAEGVGSRVEVHLVVDYRVVVEQVAARVRGVVAAVLGAEAGWSEVVVDVYVSDVAAPTWLEEAL